VRLGLGASGRGLMAGVRGDDGRRDAAARAPDHSRHRARLGRPRAPRTQGRSPMSGENGASIDVDIGGTFTDCFVRLADGRMAAAKTPTTGYRLAVGVMRALQSAGTELRLAVERLLSIAANNPYSTTVALNTLL